MASSPVVSRWSAAPEAESVGELRSLLQPPAPRVVVAARRASTGNETVRLITVEGGKAVCIESDVRDRNQVDVAIASALREYGALDIVVHNAGSASAGEEIAIEDIGAERWSDEVGVALDGAFHLAQGAFTALCKSGRGRFIVMCSVQGILGGAFNPAMSATKAGQRGMVKALAHEWGRDGILVNGVVPAATSPASRAFLQRMPDVRERLAGTIPLGRFGDPREDIGSALVALAGDSLRYMTGQILNINGGSFTAL